MLYSLVQCSAWNRKWHSFILCKCMRGDGVADPDHVCTLISDEEHVYLWEESHRLFNAHAADDKNMMKLVIRIFVIGIYLVVLILGSILLS